MGSETIYWDGPRGRFASQFNPGWKDKWLPASHNREKPRVQQEPALLKVKSQMELIQLNSNIKISPCNKIWMGETIIRRAVSKQIKTYQHLGVGGFIKLRQRNNGMIHIYEWFRVLGLVSGIHVKNVKYSNTIWPCTDHEMLCRYVTSSFSRPRPRGDTRSIVGGTGKGFVSFEEYIWRSARDNFKKFYWCCQIGANSERECTHSRKNPCLGELCGNVQLLGAKTMEKLDLHPRIILATRKGRFQIYLFIYCTWLVVVQYQYII